MSVMIHIQSFVGQMLYIGFCAEVKRCNADSMRREERERMSTHLHALQRLYLCMHEEKLTIVKTLHEFFDVTKEDDFLNPYYEQVHVNLKEIDFSIGVQRFVQVEYYIGVLLEEEFEELEKIFPNKKKIQCLILALSNLPKVYLTNGMNISQEDAVFLMNRQLPKEIFDRKK